MDVLLAAGGTGQEVAAAVIRLCYLTGRETPQIVVFDSDIAQYQPQIEAETRMQVLNGLNQQLQELGVNNQSRLHIWNPSTTPDLVKPIRKVGDLYATTGFMRADDEALLALLLDDAQRGIPVHNGFHGEPAVGSLLFAGAWARQTFADLEEQLEKWASAGTGLRVVLAGSVAGGVGTAVLPFLSRLLTKLRTTNRNVEILSVLQLPWFQLRRSEHDQLSRDPDVTEAQFDRNAACLVRGYLSEVQEEGLDTLVLLGLPQRVERVSHGGDRQRETLHYVCVCAGMIAVNLLDAKATTALLGENSKGVFGFSLKTSDSPSAFDGPPAGPALYLEGQRTVSLHDLLDIARSLRAYTEQVRSELSCESPSAMHHASISAALKTLRNTQNIEAFKRTIDGLSNMHGRVLEWLWRSLHAGIGSGRADTLKVFDPPGGWDVMRTTNPRSVLRVASQTAASWFAPPRRLLSLLPARERLSTNMSGRDAAWHYVHAVRSELLTRLD